MFCTQARGFQDLEQESSQERPDFSYTTVMKIDTSRLKTVRPVLNFSKSGKYGGVTVFD